MTEAQFMHDLATELFPLPRSLTGDGVRQTLSVLQRELPGLRMHEVPTGYQAFDWNVPDEWNIRSARLIGPGGETIVDFANSNLHVVNYSQPFSGSVTWEELQPHLHSIPEMPEAIPYATSYYNRTWGFCLTESQRSRMQSGDYWVNIDSTLEPGSLTYAELLMPGESSEEIFVTTYVCHPSMANNELSGPVVSVALAQWLASLPTRRYSYRFVFAPETIGALVYASLNLETLRTRVIAGLNLTCIGDDGNYSYLASRQGDLPIDHIARHVVQARPQAVVYSYLDRGSDERQYGAPGIDLPMISLMRTKYGQFPEYHTSLDDLTFVTPEGLQGGLDLVREVIQALEVDCYYTTTTLGEPQLGKRGLYHLLGTRTIEDEVALRRNVLAYADGRHSTTDMAILFNASTMDVHRVATELVDHGLLFQSFSPSEI